MKPTNRRILEMPQVADLVTCVLRITVLNNNKKWSLNWLRKRHGWKEISRPGATRLSIAFIALKCLCDHKHDLQVMVTFTYYKKVYKLAKAKEVEMIILYEIFWDNCLVIVNVMTQLLRHLRFPCTCPFKPRIGNGRSRQWWP